MTHAPVSDTWLWDKTRTSRVLFLCNISLRTGLLSSVIATEQQESPSSTSEELVISASGIDLSPDPPIVQWHSSNFRIILHAVPPYLCYVVSTLLMDSVAIQVHTDCVSVCMRVCVWVCVCVCVWCKASMWSLQKGIQLSSSWPLHLKYSLWPNIYPHFHAGQYQLHVSLPLQLVVSLVLPQLHRTHHQQVDSKPLRLLLPSC